MFKGSFVSFIHLFIEDLTLKSLHTVLVFQTKDKGVACPPLSSVLQRCVQLPFQPCTVFVFLR